MSERPPGRAERAPQRARGAGREPQRRGDRGVPGCAPDRPSRLVTILPDYLRIAWWGIVSPRFRETSPLEVVQGVVRSEQGVLLAVRRELRGWELPGGAVRSGEGPEAALRREILEETGVRVEVERLVGEYRRTGFRPHRARVYLCRAMGGEPTPSSETPRVEWFDLASLPDTLFPWYRLPLRDALEAGVLPVTRREHQGITAILKGMWVDLRMRFSRDRAGR